ncbi:MAG: hypothetical protein QOD75_1003, partial [Blastocatellia bacterium]|nr:hypothetical protein [Blastocatellia bacterium]
MSSRQKLFLGRFKLLTLLVLVIGVLALTQGSVRNLVVNGSFAKASDGKGNQPLFANPTSPVFINEILYDIVSTDAGEFVEVAAPAGTNMANYSIVLYNGSGGAVYDTDALTGTTTDQQGGYGTVSVSYPSNGIQNGSPDGIALINTSTNTLVQFLCYEGTFVGVGGLANGVTCTDIGVSQSGSNAAGTSLQLQGTGGSYGEFTWNATSLANTQNAPNTGQTFTAPVATPTPTPSGSPTPTPTPTPTPSPTPTPTPTPTATPAVFISDLAQAEGNSSTTPFTFTVTLLAPEQAAGVTFDVDTVDDTATTADNDYIGFHATGLTIPAGSSSRSFTVQVNGDTTLEPNQTFFVNISNVVGAAVIDGQAVGTILNDEGVGSSSVVISQVYGGGGNSGSTFKNDFIELYNRGSSPVNLSGWSVQFAGATATFQATSPLDGSPLTTNLSGIIQPGHYFLIKETAGTTGNPTTDLPPADVTGNIAVGSTAGKVALVNNTTVLSGTCPSFAANGIVDFVGYGAANCAETTPAAVISNTQAAIRKNGGCTDTDHNFNDFETAGGPIPRNSSSPINTCGGDPTQLGAVGTSNPTSVDPGQGVLLMVTVTTATSPPSTGVSVSGDLSTMGGSASQQFYDDGTHGDTVAGNNVYSFLATVDPVTPTGVKNIPVTVTDAQARIAFAGIAVSVASPTCGAERWSIKVGTDAEANQVNLNSATPVTVADMRGWAAPSPSPPPTRVAPYEKTVWVIHGTLINYKKEDDVDYHIVMQDGAGNTVITEVPCPCCAIGSPFEPR